MSRRAHGLRAWLIQRFSAVYMALFLLFILARFWAAPVQDHVEWHNWMRDPIINLSVGLFILAVLIHAWVGIRDVIMDYVKPIFLRVTLLAAIALMLVGTGLWSLRVLFVLVA